MKKTIVVSAVNLVEAGPLAILQSCLKYVSKHLAQEYKIIALVNNKKLALFENITYLEFPKSKLSWIHRLYYEYFYFKALSKRLKPYLWLSLHDITPNVKADLLAVYCHNASPFYEMAFKEAWMDPKFALFNKFYKYLYSININKNNFVIVQQDAFRKKLEQLFKIKNVIVSCPDRPAHYSKDIFHEKRSKKQGCVFFYPSFPRVFKNFEIICKASEALLKQGVRNFQVIFTISGKENRYSKFIYNSFKHIRNITFLGRQTADEIAMRYHASDCIIFPSKLETWGIPIDEAKSFKKPILLADLEYAHETLGAYDKAIFFNPNDENQLACCMKEAMSKTPRFQKTESRNISGLFSKNWEGLFDILLRPQKKFMLNN